MSTLLRPAATPTLALADLPGRDSSMLVTGDVDGLTISGMGLDSRTIEPGWLYVALAGLRAHGASFTGQAVDRGAVAVLTDASGRDLIGQAGLEIPVVVVDDPRSAMATIAAHVFGEPSTKLAMYGITGTNGKTTTAYLVEAGLRATGVAAGTIGTMGYHLGGQALASSRSTVTTPESVDLQALLAVFVERGAQSCVMEVSSHALALHRADAIEFEVVGFTHLGRDHLDFHHTIEDYFEAKARLFEPGRSRHAVVMVDDESGRELARRITAAASPQLTTVSGRADSDADVRVISTARGDDGGSTIELDLAGQRVRFSIELPGEHNVRNAALALAMVAAAGGDVHQAATGLAQAQVPGRMQRVTLEGGPTVIVDFAHTPQAISEAVTVASSFARTAVVLGAGGDRDTAKREPMGAAAAVTDLVIVTDDNPRSEDPAAIRAQVVAGAQSGRAEVCEAADRREAIRQALSWAHHDDLVLVLGKGHEQGQQLKDEVIAFDDAIVVGEVWQEVRGAQS